MKKGIRFITVALLAILTIGLLAATVPKAFGIAMLSALPDGAAFGAPTGSLLVAVPTKPSTIKIGEVIVYPAPDGSATVRRVAEIDNANQQFAVEASGAQSDGPLTVPFKDVTGVVRFSAPMAGYLMRYLSTTPGLTIAGLAAADLLLVVILLAGRPSKKKGGAPQEFARPLAPAPEALPQAACEAKPPARGNKAPARTTYSRNNRYQPKY